MKTITMPSKTHTVTLAATDWTRLARGHQPHQSGAGQHKHKGTKRNRTRSQKRQAAMREFS